MATVIVGDDRKAKTWVVESSSGKSLTVDKLGRDRSDKSEGAGEAEVAEVGKERVENVGEVEGEGEEVTERGRGERVIVR